MPKLKVFKKVELTLSHLWEWGGRRPSWSTSVRSSIDGFVIVWCFRVQWMKSTISVEFYVINY
jgi:hypothetical protein